MGRGTRRQGEETRERILDAALPLFADLGFAGASTRKLAESADCNVATIAYYFGDKAGLYLAVLQRLQHDLDAATPSLQPTDPQRFVQELIVVAWTFVNAHQVHIRLALRHVLDEGHHVEEVVDSWNLPLLARADEIIAWFRPEWPVPRRRMLVLTTMHAMVRMAIEDRKQLQKMLGGSSVDVDAEVVDWFTRQLERELGLAAMMTA